MSAIAPDHRAVRPEPPKTYYDDLVNLPGYGDAPDRCRAYSPVGFCHAGHVVLGRSSCGTRYCPDHWRDWCEDAVVAVVARLAAYREVQEGAEKRLSHVVASPPQHRRYTADRLWETRSEAYDALEAAGVTGGVAVTHPYRTNDRGDALWEAATELGEVEAGTGKWAFLRRVADDWEDLSRYVEASPHYHALAAGTDIRGDRAPDGWVVERIRSLSRFHRWDTQSYRDMARVVYYLLTHGGVQDGRQTVTYFSEIHPASFDPEEELTAAAWDRIQREAEKAVKERPEDALAGEGKGTEECPHDGCDAHVHDILHLRDLLADPDWVRRVKRHPRRWLTLQGLDIYLDGRTDRPPPGVVTNEARFLQWFEDIGRAQRVDPQQQGLPGVSG